MGRRNTASTALRLAGLGGARSSRGGTDTRRNFVTHGGLGIWWVVALLVLVSPTRVSAQSCWGGSNDMQPSGGFVCVELTQTLLLKLRAASGRDVVRAMGAPGRLSKASRLHFLSNYNNGEAGSGEVAFSFGPDRKVVIIDAVINGGTTGPIKLFVWTADGANCSDFPGSASRCDK
jgi:hypothetical protein